MARLARMRPASVAFTSRARRFFGGFKFRDGLRAGMSPLGARGIWFDPFGAEFFHFLQTDFFK